MVADVCQFGNSPLANECLNFKHNPKKSKLQSDFLQSFKKSKNLVFLSKIILLIALRNKKTSRIDIQKRRVIDSTSNSQRPSKTGRHSEKFSITPKRQERTFGLVHKVVHEIVPQDQVQDYNQFALLTAEILIFRLSTTDSCAERLSTSSHEAWAAHWSSSFA